MLFKQAVADVREDSVLGIDLTAIDNHWCDVSSHLFPLLLEEIRNVKCHSSFSCTCNAVKNHVGRNLTVERLNKIECDSLDFLFSMRHNSRTMTVMKEFFIGE